MLQPATSSTTGNAVRSITNRIPITGLSLFTFVVTIAAELFLQLPDVIDERIDLAFGKFLLKARHFAAPAIVDGVKYSLVANPALPFGVRQISRVF
jgi:hypothetical protein